MNKRNIGEMFADLYEKLTSPNFGKNLGGELPIYVQPYPIEQQDEVAGQMGPLLNRLSKSNFPAVDVSLYEICLDSLREDGILDAIFENEPDYDQEELLENVVNNIDPDNLVERIANKAVSNSVKPKVIFVTGVGDAYPMTRAHLMLSNLQSLAEEYIVVMFYPGTYDNQAMSLFGVISPDHYYRAYNIDEIRI